MYDYSLTEIDFGLNIRIMIRLVIMQNNVGRIDVHGVRGRHTTCVSTYGHKVIVLLDGPGTVMWVMYVSTSSSKYVMAFASSENPSHRSRSVLVREYHAALGIVEPLFSVRIYSNRH